MCLTCRLGLWRRLAHQAPREPRFAADRRRAQRRGRDRWDGGHAQASLQVAIRAWPDWACLSCASPAPGSQRQTRSRCTPRRPARPRRRPRLLAGSHRCPRPQTLGAPAPGRLHLNPWCGNPKGTSAPKEAAPCMDTCSGSHPQASVPSSARLERRASLRRRWHTRVRAAAQNLQAGRPDIMQEHHARTAGQCPHFTRGLHTSELCLEAPCPSDGLLGPLASSK